MRTGTAGAIRDDPAGRSGVSPSRLGTSSNGDAAATAAERTTSVRDRRLDSARSKPQNSSGNRWPVRSAASSSPTRSPAATPKAPAADAHPPSIRPSMQVATSSSAASTGSHSSATWLPATPNPPPTFAPRSPSPPRSSGSARTYRTRPTPGGDRGTHSAVDSRPCRAHPSASSRALWRAQPRNRHAPRRGATRCVR